MQQPLFILSEDSERTRGKDAQESNITAGKAVANAVRTTLGPRGMDKMLVDSSGDVVVTNDGATILNEMDIEHPAAQMIVEVAENQEIEVGDGTTTAAVLAGELLSQAEDLLDSDIHPTVIVEGYHEAARFAAEAIDEQVIEAEPSDEQLREVAETSMTGKGTGNVTAETLAEHVVAAVRQIQADDGSIDREDIQIHTQVGASTSATEVVEGVIVDEEPAHQNMPRSVEDATVAILDAKLEVREAEIDTEYNITSVEQLNAAIDAEEKELRGYVEALEDAGVDVLFATKSIEDRVVGHLADAGILAFESLSSSDARSLANATGATQLGTIQDIDPEDLGTAESITVETYDEDDLAFVTGGTDAKNVTLFARGGTEHAVEELDRALNDGIDVVIASIERNGIVPGAGGTEIAIADHVRDHAASVEGRKQLAIESFADAVDALPRTLAENTGMDPIDALVDLRSAFDADGRAGIIATGQHGTIGDPIEAAIFDPAAVKHEAIESATEAATLILRIDDVISAD